MGRTLLADESIEGYIEKLISTGTWHIGLIVGHVRITPRQFAKSTQHMREFMAMT